MKIEEWRPEPRPALPPPKPVSRWRTVLINTLIFTAAFLACLAVFGRHEIAAYVKHSAESPPTGAVSAARPALPNISSGVRPPPTLDQAAIRSQPAGILAGQTPHKPHPLPTSAPVRLPEAVPPVVDRPLP
jgi:hypothetical protein